MAPPSPRLDPLAQRLLKHLIDAQASHPDWRYLDLDPEKIRAYGKDSKRLSFRIQSGTLPPIRVTLGRSHDTTFGGISISPKVIGTAMVDDFLSFYKDVVDLLVLLDLA